MCKQILTFSQKLNLFNGGPVCHRKLPSVHTLNVTTGNTTDGSLVQAYTNFKEDWPSKPSASLKYMIRQVAEGKWACVSFIMASYIYVTLHLKEIGLGRLAAFGFLFLFTVGGLTCFI